MAGSRKGEHRGNAKPGSTKRKAIRGIEKPKPDKKAFRVPRIQTEDYMRQIVAVVNGLPEGSNKLPREALLDCQHYFQDEAAALIAYKRAIIAQIENATSVTQLRDLNTEMERITGQIHELIRTVADIAFKAGRFYHPVFSAQHHTIDQATTPSNMMQLIMQEIDDASRGRPSWQKPDLKLVGSNK